MASCPNCHQELTPGVVECPRCGVDTEQLSAQLRVRRAELAERRLGAPASPPKQLTPLVRKAIGAGLGALVLVFVVQAMLPRQFPEVSLVAAACNPGLSDPCIGKDRCLVAYLTPW
jgi:uncharacterized membrane protein YvbJ